MSEETHQLQAIQPFVKSRINNNLIVCQSSFMRDADAGRLLLYPLCASQTHRLSVILLKSHEKIFDNSFFCSRFYSSQFKNYWTNFQHYIQRTRKNLDHHVPYHPPAYLRRGEGGGRPTPPSGIRPFADPKGPLFVLIWDVHFWLTHPKIFLKAPLAPIFIYLRGSARRKNAVFLVKSFQKVPENACFWPVFFSKLTCGAENLVKMRSF